MRSWRTETKRIEKKKKVAWGLILLVTGKVIKLVEVIHVQFRKFEFAAG